MYSDVPRDMVPYFRERDASEGDMTRLGQSQEEALGPGTRGQGPGARAMEGQPGADQATSDPERHEEAR